MRVRVSEWVSDGMRERWVEWEEREEKSATWLLRERILFCGAYFHFLVLCGGWQASERRRVVMCVVRVRVCVCACVCACMCVRVLREYALKRVKNIHIQGATTYVRVYEVLCIYIHTYVCMCNPRTSDPAYHTVQVRRVPRILYVIYLQVLFVPCARM